MSNKGRGALQIAAAAANLLLGGVLLLFGLAALSALLIASLQVGSETWETLGARVANGLGADTVAILQLFNVNLSTLLADFATSQGLPALSVVAREILAGAFIGLALFTQAGATALVAARALWRMAPTTPRGLLQLYGVVVSLLGIAGIAIAAAPHLIWGLVLAIGLLTLVAQRRVTQVPRNDV
jgi:hypothetical protein